MGKINYIFSVILLSISLFPVAVSQSLSDAQVKERIIQESIQNYRGNCPCPYNKAKNGSNCGRRSAYSKPGGYAPKCYANDITKQEVQAWRNQRKSY